jgi:exopolysaccharide production protein ExoQ
VRPSLLEPVRLLPYDRRRMETAAEHRNVSLAGLIAAVALFSAAAVMLLVSGPSTIVLGLVALLLAPLALYVALRRPLDFPFGLYVLLVPFDNLLGLGAFGTLTRLLGIVAGVFLMIWILRRHNALPVSRPLAILIALAAWMLASSFWALNQGVALQILPTYVGLFLLYAVLSSLPISPAQFRILLWLVVAGSLCAAVYGIDIFYHHPNYAATDGPVRLVMESGSTKIDPNHFADVLLFPVAIVMMWSLRMRNIVAKLAGIAALVVLVTAILLSGSREGFTGILLIGVFYLVRSRYRLQLALVGGALALVVATMQTSVWVRFSTALATGGSGRTSIWAVGWEAAKHNLLVGYGLGNFQNAYDLFYLKVQQVYPFGYDSPAHNILIHYIVELGIVGLALLGWFFWAQFRSLKDIGPTNDLYDDRVTMEAALVAIIGVSMTIDLFTYKYAWLVFSMIALLRNASLAAQLKEPIRAASSSIIPALSARFSKPALPASPIRRSSDLSKSAS